MTNGPYQMTAANGQETCTQAEASGHQSEPPKTGNRKARPIKMEFQIADDWLNAPGTTDTIRRASVFCIRQEKEKKTANPTGCAVNSAFV